MLSAHRDIFIKNEVPIRQVFTPGFSRDDITAAIDQSVQDRHGQSIAELLVAEQKSIWGIKDPQLTYHLEALKQFLPDTRFIIITRDARAVVRSYIENAWGLGTNCYTGALRWRRELELQLAFEKSVPSSVLRLRYEDLITDQQRCLQQICEFIDIPFDESMMNYASKKAFVSKNRQSVNTFKAPDSAMIDKWKQGLTEHQIKIINTVCGSVLSQAGYEQGDKYNRVSGWLKLYYQLHQLIIGEFQIQYRWRIGGYRKAFRRWLAGRSHGQA
jgi:hypothetical protein